jgi:hypothetical protein
MSIVDKFEDPAEYSGDNLYLKALIYGKSGSGKTRLAVANKIPGINKGLKTLILLLENQGKVTINEVKESKFLHDETRVLSIKSVRDLQDIILYLKKEDHGFELIVLDTVDEIQEMMKREFYKSSKKKGKYILTQQEWQDLIAKVKAIVASFRDIDIHFIGLVHLTETFSEDNGYSRFPAFSGKNAPDLISGLVNITGCIHKTITDTGKIIRQIKFEGDTTYLTKSLECLRYEEDCWFPLLIAKFRGDIKRSDGKKEYMEFCKKNKVNENKKPVKEAEKEKAKTTENKKAKPPAKPVIPKDNKTTNKAK